MNGTRRIPRPRRRDLGPAERPSEPPPSERDSSPPPRERTDSQPPPTPAGRRVGRYDVTFEIAAGGMATVYLARLKGAEGFAKVVALKCIHPHLSRDPRFVEMFLDEARIASHVTHPHVCQIFDFGEADGQYYLAMEYLVGEPMARVHRRAVEAGDPAGSARYQALVARMIGDACEGLHAVHELTDSEGHGLEVVHRDVSPQNLFVTYDGVVKVVDFGIARAKHKTHRTSTGEIKGNISYIAPEQIRGERVDRRADVWSLGVVAWEMLSGVRLFKRTTTVETMYAVLQDPIPRLDEVSADVAPELVEVVDRCLKRGLDERWGSARELALALQDAMQPHGGWPSTTDLASWMDERFPQGRARHRWLVRRASEAAARSPEASEVKHLVQRRRWVFGGVSALLIAACAVLGYVGGRWFSSRSAAAAEDTGAVDVVTSRGWASVHRDGRRLGQTPLRVRLPAGRHILEVRPYGAPPARRMAVEVSPGTRETLRVSLEPP